MDLGGWRLTGAIEYDFPADTTNKTWELTLPLVSGPNTIALQSVDFQGNDLGSLFSPGDDSITITSTAQEPTPFEYLRITELHYHPADDDDLEFIELHNLSDQPLDHTGVRFADEIEFAFADGTTMAAGAYAVVVRDRAAFEANYGTDILILGERVELLDGPHRILAFDYRDDWDSETDGAGKSLIIVDPNADRANWDDAGGWGISHAVGGSPGSPNVVGTGGGESGLAKWTEITLAGDEIIATYQRVRDLDYSIELSQDLQGWETVVIDNVTVIPLNDDLELVTLRIPHEQKRRYVRIAISE